MKWNLKRETSLLAERPETRQHFFYFFTFFLLPPHCSSARTAIVEVLLRKTRPGRRQCHSSCAGCDNEVERSSRRLPTHWQLRLLPPDIRAFGGWLPAPDQSDNRSSVAALFRLSAMISQYFILCRAWLLFVERPWLSPYRSFGAGEAASF